jgi:hypothetical protein
VDATYQVKYNRFADNMEPRYLYIYPVGRRSTLD